jgi:hypothetical protein
MFGSKELEVFFSAHCGVGGFQSLRSLSGVHLSRSRCFVEDSIDKSASSTINGAVITHLTLNVIILVSVAIYLISTFALDAILWHFERDNLIH